MPFVRCPEPRIRASSHTTLALLEELHRRAEQGRLAREHPRVFASGRPMLWWSSGLLNYVARRMGVPEPGRSAADRCVRLPATFSFIDDPEAALGALGTFLRCARDGARTIAVDQQACEQLDLCAGSVLNVLALEAHQRLRTRFMGAWPRTLEPLEIVVATGLPRLLGVPLPELPRFSTFDLLHGGATARRSKLRTSRKEQATTDLVRYVQRWFLEHGYAFSGDGMHRLGKLVGEVLANAEDHSGRGEWWAAGYLRRPTDGAVGDCHLTIFSFGDTLAESLQSLPANSGLRQDIEALVIEHTRRGLFERERWTEEALWTLYALQDGVTRHYEQRGSRGVGTADMIEEFQFLGQTHAGTLAPRMCVMSGHTHILFDGRYHLRAEQTVENQERRVIAFNDTNTLSKRPDPTAVRTLRQFFPGTLISLRFYLDRDYLLRIGGGHHA